MAITKNNQYKLLIALAFTLSQISLVCSVEPESILAPSIGPVVLLPRATLSASYNDNVFLYSDSNKIDDYITTLSSGISLQYGENIIDSNYIGLDYSPSFLWYNENNELNTDNHTLGFAINYQKEGKFTFSGSDQIMLDSALLSGRERTYYSTLRDSGDQSKTLLVERLSLADDYRFEYTISPKTSAYVSVSANTIDFEEEPHYYYKTVFGELVPFSLYDISNWNNTVGFGWQAFPKIKFYGSFFYGSTSVERNLDRMSFVPDSEFYGGHISANGNFSDKLSGRVQLGYQTRDFDRLSNTIGSDSHSLPIFQTELGYKYTEKGSVNFSYNRGGLVSVENPDIATKSDFLSLSLTQKLGTTGKLSASINSTVELTSFEIQDETEYDYMRFGSALNYSFNQWMRASFDYSHELFNSNKGNVDYNVNKFMFVFSVGY